MLGIFEFPSGGFECSISRLPVYIKLRFFNRDFETNIHEFDRQLRLPHDGVWTIRHENFNV